MASDDFFDTGTVDGFENDVHTLIRAYKSFFESIDRLDEKKRRRPNLDLNPELQMELEWWDQEILAMKRNAGYMGLVSLVSCFEGWLKKNSNEKFQDSAKLKKDRFSEICTARNSIIHHGGKPEYERHGKKWRVSEEFLGYDEMSGENRISIGQDLLKKVADEFTMHVSEQRSQAKK